MHSISAEEESLKVVEDFLDALTHALDSFGDKTPSDTLLSKYRFWSSKHLYCAADGFAFLRRSGHVKASKFLIRPAIELAFRLEAARKHPNVYYRMMFEEHHREKQLLQVAAERGEPNLMIARSVEEKWRRFNDDFAKEFPGFPKVEKTLPIKYVAEKAEMKDIYNDHFRIYSQYTHGALAVSIGYRDEGTDRSDNQAMAACSLIALDNLISLGAVSPNHGDLAERILRLSPKEAGKGAR